MKAEVIKSYKHFKEGEIVTIEDEAIFYNGHWICDVPSSFFYRHFKLIED